MLNVPDPIPEKTHPGPAFWRGIVNWIVLVVAIGVIVWALFL